MCFFPFSIIVILTYKDNGIIRGGKIFSFLWICILHAEIFCQTGWFFIKSACKNYTIVCNFKPKQGKICILVGLKESAKLNTSIFTIHAKIFGFYMIFPNFFCETNNFLRNRFWRLVTFSTSGHHNPKKYVYVMKYLKTKVKLNCWNRVWLLINILPIA